LKKLSVVSLFSGCGGLDLGFVGGFSFLGKDYKKNNYDIIWANDIDESACKSYKNYFKHEITCGDISEVISEEDTSNDQLPLKTDIVLGGFPCQDFSHAGKRKGFESDRGNLYQAMCSVIKRTEPKIFLAENVKGLLTSDNGSAIRKITNDFESLGYHISYKLLITADFEVPQKRERVVIVGTNKSLFPKFIFPEPLLCQENWITLEKAIGDLQKKPEGHSINHFWSKAKRNKGQGNNTVAKNEPAPTMRAEHHGNIEFHWNGERRLSAREAARIQSFPDDFYFYPSTSSAYRQIGNAVPPVFGWHLARSIESFIQNHLSTKSVKVT